MGEQVTKITNKEVDFAQWYTDVCLKAELMDYSDIKGFIIYRPYGYALWEGIMNFVDTRLKATKHENVYMPSFIPSSLFNKEKEHVQGFAPECAIVTKGGSSELAEEYIIRPTSEVLFCSHYAKIISSYRDLPKLYNQWCSVVRWEKSTRPFLRGKEFLWQEGHTIHETKEDALKELETIQKIYLELGRDLLCIPFVTGRKTESEKFAGADWTNSFEALMPDGQALQSGTTHYFGQKFSIPFNMKFTTKENKIDFVHQTSWGVSTRLLGAIIMVHGDNNGLVLPPLLAPIQVAIIPIKSDRPEVVEAYTAIYNQLVKAGIRVKLDTSNQTPGWKFNEYEMKGIPIRIEVGPRDLENGQVTLGIRYNQTKIQISKDDVKKTIPKLLKEISKKMLDKAKLFVDSHTREAKNYEEFKALIKEGGYVKASIFSEVEEKQIKTDTTAIARCIVEDKNISKKKCLLTGKPATQTVLFARSY